jgi:hypothetical protein
MSIFQLGGLEEVGEMLGHLDLWIQICTQIQAENKHQ